MATQNENKWSPKELEEFKSLIINKRNKVINELDGR